jgi:hypothetical protein
MEKCKVTFKEGKQKIIIDFTVSDNGDAEYKTHFEPQVDMKTPLGLAGHLCQLFIEKLHENDAPVDVAETEPASDNAE